MIPVSQAQLVLLVPKVQSAQQVLKVRKVFQVLLGQWARLLHAVPNSRLYLRSGPYTSEDMQQRLLGTMAQHGIEAERIRLEGYALHYQLLESYNDVDIALDPWPYSGGLTTCEAMLMGVPVAPRHVICPVLPSFTAADADFEAAQAEKKNPFDVLKALKPGKPGG